MSCKDEKWDANQKETKEENFEELNEQFFMQAKVFPNLEVAKKFSFQNKL